MTHSEAAQPNAVSGEREEIDGRSGRLSYYVAGVGAPVLLIHSINAVASAYEVRPLFERLQKTRRVFAVDLPGFGFSDRSRREYTVRLYTNAVHDMLDVIEDEPVDVVALSLSSEFAARAIAETSVKVRSLTMVTPTGLGKSSDELRQPGKTRKVPGLRGVLEFPLWRKRLYRALVSRGSIRYFMRKTFGRRDIPEDMAEYNYLVARQPGAENAPYAFLSGSLFSKDIRLVYESLDLPVWVPFGTRGDFGDCRGADWARDRWRIETFNTGALVHFEELDAFLSRFDRFIAETA